MMVVATWGMVPETKAQYSTTASLPQAWEFLILLPANSVMVQ